MSWSISAPVASWLTELGILEAKDLDSPPGDVPVTLSRSAAAEFENGVRVGQLLQVLSNEDDAGLDTLKELHTPVAKLYNWNVLLPVLTSRGVQVDSDMKVLIVAGDVDIVADVLNQLHGARASSTAGRRRSPAVAKPAAAATPSLAAPAAANFVAKSPMTTTPGNAAPNNGAQLTD